MNGYHRWQFRCLGARIKGVHQLCHRSGATRLGQHSCFALFRRQLQKTVPVQNDDHDGYHWLI